MADNRTDPDDLVVWPDGTQCLRHELAEFQHMSDDYELVPFDTLRWRALTGTLSVADLIRDDGGAKCLMGRL